MNQLSCGITYVNSNRFKSRLIRWMLDISLSYNNSISCLIFRVSVARRPAMGQDCHISGLLVTVIDLVRRIREMCPFIVYYTSFSFNSPLPLPFTDKKRETILVFCIVASRFFLLDMFPKCGTKCIEI